jgi:hypothetical protein
MAGTDRYRMLAEDQRVSDWFRFDCGLENRHGRLTDAAVASQRPGERVREPSA